MSARGALCGAKTRAPDRHGCRRPAGWGTDHLGWGRCRLHGGASPSGKVYAARLQAEAEGARLGLVLEVDPAEALAAIVNLLAGQVEVLNRQVAKIDAGEIVTREQLHPTLRALNGVLEQWGRAAKSASDAGVAERRVELDEAVVARLADAVHAALAEVALSAKQEEQLREAVTRHLTSLDDLDWRRPREITA